LADLEWFMKENNITVLLRLSTEEWLTYYDEFALAPQ
jgi:hypothetical protein